MYDTDLTDAEKVYAECGQQGPLPWKECFSTLQMKRCVKIGEGTFGEVFSTNNSSGETVALKVRVYTCINLTSKPLKAHVQLFSVSRRMLH